uniref:Uncharacterized protein n=1 Tax=Romanomermis culicivorax TaxID=13658 RepID=A0A915I6S8_ROMCU
MTSSRWLYSNGNRREGLVTIKMGSGVETTGTNKNMQIRHNPKCTIDREMRWMLISTGEPTNENKITHRKAKHKEKTLETQKYTKFAITFIKFE